MTSKYFTGFDWWILFYPVGVRIIRRLRGSPRVRTLEENTRSCAVNRHASASLALTLLVNVLFLKKSLYFFRVGVMLMSTAPGIKYFAVLLLSVWRGVCFSKRKTSRDWTAAIIRAVLFSCRFGMRGLQMIFWVQLGLELFARFSLPKAPLGFLYVSALALNF